MTKKGKGSNENSPGLEEGVEVLSEGEGNSGEESEDGSTRVVTELDSDSVTLNPRPLLLAAGSVAKKNVTPTENPVMSKALPLESKANILASEELEKNKAKI